jgi:glycosyltransferase involved in cell wall biosynthesis
VKVSVCTSVLNQSAYLRKMVDSVLASTFKDFELIIVDDGSTEDIAGLLNDYKDSRIYYVRWDENRGIPHGLNHAFSIASGEYIQPLSADEWITPDKLQEQVDYLDGHPDIGCVWGLPGKGEMGKRPEWEQYALRAHNRSKEAWIRTLLRLENIPIGGASLLMRREIMAELKGFDPEFFHCSDLELFVRFFQKHDGRVLCYRWADADQPDTRLTAPSPENAKRFQEDMKKLHEKHKLVLPRPSGRVTVFIPVYNMAQYIGKALESLKAQTFQDFDILILDDASTDDLALALAAHAEPRITLLKFEENSGVRKALNAGIALCETEFFVSIAADDWIEPTYLERALKEFQNDPYLEFVASQTDFMDEAGNPLPQGANQVQIIERAANKPREHWLGRLWHGNVYFGVGMYRTYALKEVGGFDTEAGVLCDYDMYLKLLQRENIKIIEENLTHTRIHPGNSSIGKFTPEWLRDKYAEIRKRYFPPRQKVIFATPFYEMKAYSPYVHSMFYTVRQLQAMNIWCEFWDLSGDSYVDRAKNTLFNKFLEDPEATDLFMIDSDMQWNIQAVLTMIALPDEIVIGSYPQKNSWGKWTSVPKMQQNGDGGFHPIGRALPDGSALIQSEYLSGGFMRIKRSVLEKYKAKYTQDTYIDPSADPSKHDRVYTNFFICEVRDGLRWGEDRFFGKRLVEMGIQTMIYPNIDFMHYGVKGWGGNFDKWLRDPKLQAPPDNQNATQERIT